MIALAFWGYPDFAWSPDPLSQVGGVSSMSLVSAYFPSSKLEASLMVGALYGTSGMMMAKASLAFGMTDRVSLNFASVDILPIDASEDYFDFHLGVYRTSLGLKLSSNLLVGVSGALERFVVYVPHDRLSVDIGALLKFSSLKFALSYKGFYSTPLDKEWSLIEEETYSEVHISGGVDVKRFFLSLSTVVGVPVFPYTTGRTRDFSLVAFSGGLGIRLGSSMRVGAGFVYSPPDLGFSFYMSKRLGSRVTTGFQIIPSGLGYSGMLVLEYQ